MTDLGASLNRIAVIADGSFWFETDWNVDAMDLVDRSIAHVDRRYEVWEKFERGSLLIRRSGYARVAQVRRAA